MALIKIWSSGKNLPAFFSHQRGHGPYELSHAADAREPQDPDRSNPKPFMAF